jgi:hypothetical protein
MFPPPPKVTTNRIRGVRYHSVGLPSLAATQSQGAPRDDLTVRGAADRSPGPGPRRPMRHGRAGGRVRGQGCIFGGRAGRIGFPACRLVTQSECPQRRVKLSIAPTEATHSPLGRSTESGRVRPRVDVREATAKGERSRPRRDRRRWGHADGGRTRLEWKADAMAAGRAPNQRRLVQTTLEDAEPGRGVDRGWRRFV